MEVYYGVRTQCMSVQCDSYLSSPSRLSPPILFLALQSSFHISQARGVAAIDYLGSHLFLE